MADIMTPALGESVTEATVARWAKKAGEAVRKDEVLVELETDKVSLEVAAPAGGGVGGRQGGARQGRGGRGRPRPARPPPPPAAPKAEPVMAPSAQRIVAENKL